MPELRLERAQYCWRCGRPVVVAGAEFCKDCGAPLAGGRFFARNPGFNPVIAAALSIVPGLGHVYKGRPGRGAGWFFAIFFAYGMNPALGLLLHVICAPTPRCRARFRTTHSHVADAEAGPGVPRHRSEISGNPSMIAENTIIGGRYRVARPLGGGGMKMVYLAEDLRLAARPCALAEMVDSFTSPDMQKQAAAAFQREADMLAQLSNEHIPRVFDRFSDQNHHYLVMEFIDGITLEQKLHDSGGKLPEQEAIEIALQICDTLNYLHNLEPPVIYRDLKPSNVMLATYGQVKLIDFGIARLFQPQSNATMIGTQGYAPPEQYRGKAEVRSDLYALAATMHHALSGRDPAAEPPFSFPPLRSACSSVTQALADLIDQSLQYDAVLRVGDAAEFKSRLLAIKSGAANPNSAGTRVASQGGTSRRAQLGLPLGTRPQPSSSASSAPTVLVASNADITCPRCTRSIPPDSRFCSFCGANIAFVLQPGANGQRSANGDFG